MQVRQVIGNGEGVVVGCYVCGEVETLYGEAPHRCTGSSDPTAATISSRRLAAIPAASPVREL